MSCTRSWCPLTPSTTFTSNLSIVVPKNSGIGLTAVSEYILQLWTLRNYTHSASIWDLRKILHTVSTSHMSPRDLKQSVVLDYDIY
uniref:Uncharacterized protein n=1 Tax=Oryza barthii TaxID=65489 RepID=A0A0D3HB07_9ORYZ